MILRQDMEHEYKGGTCKMRALLYNTSCHVWTVLLAINALIVDVVQYLHQVEACSVASASLSKTSFWRVVR